MLFIHSFSSVEQILGNMLNHRNSVSQVDGRQIESLSDLQRMDAFGFHDVLVYSHQNVQEYKFLDSFTKELDRVQRIAEYACNHGIRKIIVLTSPGAFTQSDSLFLQYKGIIEQVFQRTGIPTLFLRVQAVVHAFRRIHNLHHLFYDRMENAYIIPQKSGLQIYSIQLDLLHDVIEAGIREDQTGYYDVFNEVLPLDQFLQRVNPSIPVQRLKPLYLFFKSYLGAYLSPAMLELFLRPNIPMYSFRTSKAFGVELQTAASETESSSTTDKKNPAVFERVNWGLPWHIQTSLE